MSQYELIRVAHRCYGKSINEIAKITGHSRNTIRKALREEARDYKERKHQTYPVLEPYLKIINQWLEADKQQHKKQRHTARRIYNRLVNEYDYKGSESAIRRYVQHIKATLNITGAKAFIPCDPEAGCEAEVDFGSAIAIIGGQKTKIKFFCMRSKYSGKCFVKCYTCEQQQAFFDGHIHGFNFFEGIFPVLIYDNLTSAVAKVLKGRDRIEQESYAKFKAYYNFEARFCNPGQGHEKGGVEGLVGFVRRNYMVPLPEAESIEALNIKIITQCFDYGKHKISGREKTVYELFEEEKKHLLALPYVCFSNVNAYDGRVDKYATVIIDKNRYSVPTQYVGFKVKTLLYVDHIDIFCSGKKIATHDRLYSNHKWRLTPEHYLDLIEQRPMAFNSAKPIRQWREKWSEALKLIFERFCNAQGQNQGVKDFIAVLKLYKEYKAQDVEAAVEISLKSGIKNSEGVKHILIYTGEKNNNLPPLLNFERFSPPDLTEYNQLGGVR